MSALERGILVGIIRWLPFYLNWIGIKQLFFLWHSMFYSYCTVPSSLSEGESIAVYLGFYYHFDKHFDKLQNVFGVQNTGVNDRLICLLQSMVTAKGGTTHINAFLIVHSLRCSFLNDLM